MWKYPQGFYKERMWKYPHRTFSFISPEFPQGNYEEIPTGWSPGSPQKFCMEIWGTWMARPLGGWFGYRAPAGSSRCWFKHWEICVYFLSKLQNQQGALNWLNVTPVYHQFIMDILPIFFFLFYLTASNSTWLTINHFEIFKQTVKFVIDHMGIFPFRPFYASYHCKALS